MFGAVGEIITVVVCLIIGGIGGMLVYNHNKEKCGQLMDALADTFKRIAGIFK
jgi:hypothetical protein